MIDADNVRNRLSVIDGRIKDARSILLLIKELNMSTPKSRLELEISEVDTRLEALRDLLSKPKPDFISQLQWDLMDEQYKYQSLYSAVLHKRLSAWEL